MAVKRTAHAVYDAKYHMVWAPKYRRWVEREDIRRRIGELFEEIAVNRGLDIDTMEVAADRVHVVVSFPPKHSISHVVSLLKSVSASVLFREYPEVKGELNLWRGSFWEVGYFARTVGDEVTEDVIRQYIRYHQHEERNPSQLDPF